MISNVVNLNNPAIAKPIFDIVQNESGEYVHQIPEACHSGAIRGEGQGAARTKAALDGVARTLTRLNLSRVKLDPNHESEVRSGFNSVGNEITEARNALRADEKQLVENLVQKSGFKVDPSLIPMVAGTFQSLSDNERVNKINQLIAEGAGSYLAILDSVPSVFTGLPDEVKASIRDRLFAKTDSQAYAQLEDTRFNLNRVEVASIASANAAAQFAVPMHKASGANEVHRSMVDQTTNNPGFNA